MNKLNINHDYFLSITGEFTNKDAVQDLSRLLKMKKGEQGNAASLGKTTGNVLTLILLNFLNGIIHIFGTPESILGKSC